MLRHAKVTITTKAMYLPRCQFAPESNILLSLIRSMPPKFHLESFHQAASFPHDVVIEPDYPELLPLRVEVSCPYPPEPSAVRLG